MSLNQMFVWYRLFFDVIRVYVLRISNVLILIELFVKSLNKRNHGFDPFVKKMFLLKAKLSTCCVSEPIFKAERNSWDLRIVPPLKLCEKFYNLK